MAPAAELEGVEFADRVTVEGRTLELHGLGLLRYRIVFRAYVAGLYLENAADAQRVLADVPKRLELSYFWGISGEDFAKSGELLLERNVGAARVAALRERLDRLNASYRDVEPGDRYALTYVPGRGTELALNGKPLMTIEGADFASAYFTIWLGDEALDDGLRKRLLAGR